MPSGLWYLSILVRSFFISSPEPKAQSDLLWSLTVRRHCCHCLSVSLSIHNFFKQHLLLNHFATFNQISQDGFLGNTENWLKIVQRFGIHAGFWLPWQKKKFYKPSCQKPLDWFQYYLEEIFLWWSSAKIVQAIMIHQKTWLPESSF